MSEQLYCDVAECDDPEHPGFPRPVFRYGKCQSHAKQLQRTGKTTTIAGKIAVTEQLIDAYGLYAEADSDEDAERHRRNFLTLTKKVGRSEINKALSVALKRRRDAGLPVGRPLKVDGAMVLEVYEKAIKYVGVSSAAQLTGDLLGIARSTVFRYLAVSKGRLSGPPSEREPVRPHRAG